MATLKDIANHVGISISAASLALRDHSSISVETKRRVWEAQEALGYRLPLRAPNSIAKKVKKQTVAMRNIVFLLVDRQFDNSSYGATFQKLADLGTERHWRCMYLSASLEDLRAGRIPPLLKNSDVDGIIVSGAYDSIAHQHLQKLGIPLLVYGRYELGDEPWMSCEPDFRHGARLFANRLMALGHTRYGFVFKGETGTTFSSHYTLRIVKDILEEKGLHFSGAAATHDQFDGKYLTVDELLKQDVTALLISTGSQVEMTYEACQKAGLRIPEDISIVCFNPPGNFFIRPSLAYISNGNNITQGIVEKLERFMDKPDIPRTRELFPKHLVPGGSIGLCRTST